MVKNIFSLTIVILFTFVAGLPLLHKGLLPTHDGEYHIVRFYEFNKALLDGNWYPRWAQDFNNGFGIPLFNFVYPLPNYVAVFLHVFGLSFIDSFKLEMFFAQVLGGVFFYLWTKEFWGKLGAVVSSVFYTFSPYHFVDIYIRGSVGEVWALAFFPAFLWSFTKFVRSKQKIFLLSSSLFLALIIFSHNILALMFFFFTLSYVGFLIYRNGDKRYLILNTIFIILVGLGLSAVFWLPAIYEAKYVTGLQIFDASLHFPDLYQLLIPSWGSGFSGGEISNQLSFQIGVANLIAVFLSIIVLIVGIKNKKNNAFILFFLFWFTLVFFLMLSVSSVFWQKIPLMNYFQFPWRFLSLEILIASFLAGSIFSIKKYVKSAKAKIIIATFLSFLAVFLGIGYTKPAYYHNRDDNYYLTRSSFMDGTNSPGNVFNTIFSKSIPDKEKNRAEFLRGEGSIALIKAKSHLYLFEMQAYKNSEILMNLTYYPGWEAYVNGKKKEVKSTENGRFSFSLPHGKSKVEVVFKDTLIRRFTAFISLVSLVSLFILSIKESLLQLINEYCN